jgi:hypothetical protein
MITDNFKLKGRVDLVLSDERGTVKEIITIPNLVVNTGKNYIAARMVSNANALMSHMAVGNSSTAATLTNSNLISEVSRVTLSDSVLSGNSVVYSASFPAGTATDGLTEAGIFNDAVSGEMLCRTVFAVVNKGVADTLNVTWTVSTI